MGKDRLWFKSDIDFLPGLLSCEHCGRFDDTVRIVVFPFVIGMLLVSIKRFTEPATLCRKCRWREAMKWAFICLFLGWWGLNAPLWNLGALIDNFQGGKILESKLTDVGSENPWPKWEKLKT